MKNYFDQSLAFLDTETTGLDNGAQIIEIAIIDGTGDVMVDLRLKPSVPIDERAQEVHGISLTIHSSCFEKGRCILLDELGMPTNRSDTPPPVYCETCATTMVTYYFIDKARLVQDA